MRLDLDKQRLNAKKQAFENQMKRREEEIKEENRNEIERLKKQKSDLHAQLDEMANETSALRQENRELNRKIDWQKDFDREKLEQDNRSLEKRKKELSATSENLKNRIQELENEKNKLDPRDERIEELEEEKRELEGIRAQKENAEQKYNTLSVYNKQLEAELVSLEADGNMLKERFESLKNMYAGVEDFEKRQKNIKEQIVKTNPKVLGAPSNEVEELALLERIEKGMQEFNVFYPKRLLYMFHTALKSASLSPLSVLSGVSGTGKSELSKLYVHFGGLNFLSIAVQPTWDSPESLMGYFNAIENKFDATEFLRFFIQTTLSKN
ncbi:hypothetical protein [Helicobacter pylori]|uniref:hypothetical protein n=1 Tax=Helicobacter pylori TaxID=210 RepID=UPI000AF501F7|nr:hypothetical protein [Helicobacter pylori]